MLIFTFRNKLYDLDTMKEFHIISRDDVIDIFKEVLNYDVAKNIASFIGHPIHEYIGRRWLHSQNNAKLRLRWGGHSMSANYFINNYGYILYKEERERDIRVLNNEVGIGVFAKPYLPVDMRYQKTEIIYILTKLGVKVYKSWTKQKMINHYYKTIV